MATLDANRPSPWLKRVLIPFWVVQLLVMIFIVGVFIWVIAAEPESFAVYQVVILILCAVSIVLDVTEIILFARRKLNQLTYLIFQVKKTAIWFGLFVNAIARGAVSQAGDDSVDTSITWGVVIFGILFFAFFGSLIYGGIIYHRHRHNKRKVLNPQNITQNPYYNGPYGEAGLSTANYTPIDSSYPHTAYPSTAVGPGSTVYGSEGVKTPSTETSVHATPYVVGEMDGKGGVQYEARELSAAPEVYELSSPMPGREQSMSRR